MNDLTLQVASDDVGETVGIWASPISIKRRIMQNTRNAFMLGIVCANLNQGETQSLTEGETTAINGIKQHVSGDDSIRVGFVHVEHPNSGSVPA